MSRAELLQVRLREAIAMCESMLTDRSTASVVDEIVAGTVKSIEGGGKVPLCGNGGSAADAQHLAAEIVGRFCLERRPLPAVALADNVAALTAIGNDYGYADVFARAVRGLGKPGDVLIGISTSGQSENVVAALAAAREEGLLTVAFVGAARSWVAEAADSCLTIPSSRTAGVQEGHTIVGHVIFELVERELCDP